MTKFFLDTEFYEDGICIHLISIGIVCEDGREYYAETKRAQYLVKATPWLEENVAPHLRGGDYIKYDDEIADEIVSFVGENPQFWAYFADYDWVALCQLYGTMLMLPKGFPMLCMDIKQLAMMVGVDGELPPQVGIEHDALADARWNVIAFDYIIEQLILNGWMLDWNPV